MRLVWQALASRQVNEIFRYLRERNPRAAHDWLAELHDRIDLLTKLPRIGRRTSNLFHEEMRTITVGSYHVFYAVESNDLVIVQVKHVRQNTDPQTIRDAPLVSTPPGAGELLRLMND